MTELEQTNNATILPAKPRRIQSVRYGKFRVMYRPGTAFEETRLRLVKQGLRQIATVALRAAEECHQFARQRVGFARAVQAQQAVANLLRHLGSR